MIQYFLLGIAVLLIHYCYIHYSARGRLLNKIPGPGLTLPVIGNIFIFLRHLDNIFEYGHNLINNYYPVMRAWKIFGDVGVVIHDPDDIKVLLTSKIDLNKGKIGYEIFKDYNIDGIFVSKGEKWKKRRKMVESTFNLSVLKMYMRLMNTRAKSLINDINSEGEVTVQNLFPLTMKFTFRTVCNTLLGFNNFNNSDLELGKIVHAFKLLTDYAVERVTLLYIPLSILELFPRGRAVKNASKTIFEFIVKILDDRAEYLKNKQINEKKKNHGEEYFKMKRNTGVDQLIPMIDVLLQNESEGLIDRQGVIEEMLIIIIGGYETTETTLACSILLFAENKWAQDLAREEVLKVLEGSEDEITYDMAQNMYFLERCLKETMRLFPPAHVIVRRLSENKLMSNYLIPADTDVIVDIYSLHRNPRFWLDPDKFDPDRFLPEQIKNRHAYAYIPFSSGARNCPGQKYGYLNLKVTMSQLLRNFYFEPVTRTRDLGFNPTMILYPSSPVYVKLIKINDFEKDLR